MSKKHSLTKTELEIVTRLLMIARTQETILQAITQSYKAFLLDEIFPRLKIDSVQFKNVVVNIQTGELMVNDSKKESKKNEVQK